MPVFLVGMISSALPWNATKDLGGMQCNVVVVARDEADARDIAARDCCDEGPACWLDPASTRVEFIDPNGPRRTVLSDAGDEATDGS